MSSAVDFKNAVENKDDVSASELVKKLQTSELSSLGLDAKTLLTNGLPLAAISYLERFLGEKGVGDVAVDSDGNTLLHIAAASPATTYDACKKLFALGLGVNTANKSNADTPMHVAAKCGNIEVCKALVDCGADPTKRNGKNRTPRSQPKIPESSKDYLLDVEENYKKTREEKKMGMFGAKLQETQTESAFGLRVV
ncbi:hypothetical protein CEUSTIGMA_g4709.t1 [Chlamydomonas eustigma]|uniref:Uncharacterized protein n=1 Tax=Chlamydomonas eustigma TaxID=1157962 RepID=A0A250X2E8_9CHLO|nr:hypothetical protein CEUSTIGMA_g4709.t1 [Chlamydomonas eustigma]|eukprot:GAX77263.1 hypothetical protein CEUSTIGMA_g4709.t1 [Chlamydomonas eustigma]